MRSLVETAAAAGFVDSHVNALDAILTHCGLETRFRLRWKKVQKILEHLSPTWEWTEVALQKGRQRDGPMPSVAWPPIQSSLG